MRSCLPWPISLRAPTLTPTPGPLKWNPWTNENIPHEEVQEFSRALCSTLLPLSSYYWTLVMMHINSYLGMVMQLCYDFSPI